MSELELTELSSFSEQAITDFFQSFYPLSDTPPSDRTPVPTNTIYAEEYFIADATLIMGFKHAKGPKDECSSVDSTPSRKYPNVFL